MNKLKELLEKARHKLMDAEKRLEVAGHRWQVNHDLAHEQHHKQKELEHKAQQYLKFGSKVFNQGYGEKLLRKAKRHSHKANKAHQRALYWIDKAKKATGQVKYLEGLMQRRVKKIKEVEARGAHMVSSDKAAGGSEKDRLTLVMHKSETGGSQFYSQTGTLDLYHCCTGPTPGHRHDCSSWGDSAFESADCEDMARAHFSENVWTGNEAEHGEAIQEHELDTGCAVFFGTAPFHHIELKDGPMSEGPYTVGHGSAPIDRGTVTLLPGPRAFRRYFK